MKNGFHPVIEENKENLFKNTFRPGMGKKERVKSNPHSKIDPIMPGH
jgi:hypothetical protein